MSARKLIIGPVFWENSPEKAPTDRVQHPDPFPPKQMRAAARPAAAQIGSRSGYVNRL